MTGTEKQIAFAETLKAERIPAWSVAVSPSDRRAALVAQLVEIAATIDDAEAWINGRDSAGIVLHAAGYSRAVLADSTGTDVRQVRNAIQVMDMAFAAVRAA